MAATGLPASQQPDIVWYDPARPFGNLYDKAKYLFLHVDPFNVFAARTGNVDPGTLAQIKAETSAAIQKATGGIVPPQNVKAQQDAASKEIDNYLHLIDAHPDNAPFLRLPDNTKITTPQVLWGLGIAAFVLLILPVFLRRV